VKRQRLWESVIGFAEADRPRKEDKLNEQAREGGIGEEKESKVGDLKCKRRRRTGKKVNKN